uniref:Uncharacterized protein n=1 Tax=Glossina austeni TaxID=7395 RepID=A0A1A9VX10_GLOAU
MCDVRRATCDVTRETTLQKCLFSLVFSLSLASTYAFAFVFLLFNYRTIYYLFYDCLALIKASVITCPNAFPKLVCIFHYIPQLFQYDFNDYSPGNDQHYDDIIIIMGCDPFIFINENSKAVLVEINLADILVKQFTKRFATCIAVASRFFSLPPAPPSSPLLRQARPSARSFCEVTNFDKILNYLQALWKHMLSHDETAVFEKSN